MTKFTIESLIEFLSKFPKDLEIENEIAMTWEFPEELKHGDFNPDDEEFFELTIKNATKLFVLEGNWDKETVETFNKLFDNDTDTDKDESKYITVDVNTRVVDKTLLEEILKELEKNNSDDILIGKLKLAIR